MVAADFIVGILGNIISIICYGAPIGTFIEIVKKKSAENYGGTPYVTSLLSCCLWTYYGLLDPDDGVLIVTVSAVGAVSQIVYIALLLAYYPKEKRVKYIGFVTLAMLFFGIVLAVTLVAFHEGARRTFMGVICATFTILMYAGPLTLLRTVIKTKTVEYMPFFLLVTLFISAWVWFAFALLLDDYYVLVPNATGILLGAVQLTVYFIYKNSSASTKLLPEEGSADIVKEAINMKETDLNSAEEGIKVKTQSLENEPTTVQNPFLSRQYSFKKVMQTFSFSTSISRPSLLHENDIENGGENKDQS